ncbi:hypothetical protein TRFO_01378 [Tritrichomonas foetus]|uniref:Uncharacterized protein n=1 Tax=Tritrichomonas foetus TaxID=1144522 RepID=A0A1J4K8K6_9EUKA|nr:hypothetical protein TRFO_01378 [Tritrichomonas foetus]|eukprot:OHT07216.1 hypothetical protein TRFO_01378 [Tritrichomonas foetus]
MQEAEIYEELTKISRSTQDLVAQINSHILNEDHKDIQIESKVHSIKLQANDFIAQTNKLKKLMAKNNEVLKPKEVCKLEDDYSNVLKKRQTTLELITEMHDEGVHQIDSVEKKYSFEKENKVAKFHELTEEKVNLLDMIKKVKDEFNALLVHLENETKDYQKASFTPDQEVRIGLKTELEILNEKIDSLEKDQKEKEKKLNEIESMSIKMRKYLQNQQTTSKTEITNVSNLIQKYQKKKQSLLDLFKNQIKINNELEKELSNHSNEYQNVDYVALFKTEKAKLNQEFEKGIRLSGKKNIKADKKLQKLNDAIDYKKNICADYERSLETIKSAEMKLNLHIDKLNQKDTKLTQAITIARKELDQLKLTEEADKLNDKKSAIKVLPIHVQTYTHLPPSSLAMEHAIRNKYKELFTQVTNVKHEYNQICEKEENIKKNMKNLKHENECLKKYLAPYPKIKSFFKKYNAKIRKNINNPYKANSHQQPFQPSHPTTMPKLTLECNTLAIQAT